MKTPSPNIDPAVCHVVLSSRGDAALQRLGVGTAHLERRHAVIDAAFEGIVPIPESVETQFLAHAHVAGSDVVLLCKMQPESRPGMKPLTVIVKSCYPLPIAAELLARRKGLAPFLNDGPLAGKNTHDDSPAS